MSEFQESRIREELSLMYGCPVGFFDSPGTFLRERESLAKNNAYLTRYSDQAFLTVSPENYRVLQDDFDTSAIFTPDDFSLISNSTPSVEDRLFGLVLPEDESPEFHPDDEHSLKEHDPSDRPLLESFLERCTAVEIEDAAIDLDDPDDAIVLGMSGTTPVAYSGYRILEKNMGDLGILVYPDHRRKGLALATLTASIRICRKRGYIPLYRYWQENHGSGVTAGKLGFRRKWTVEVYSLSE